MSYSSQIGLVDIFVMRNRRVALLGALGIALLAGCQRYQPRPLVPDEVIQEVERERHVANAGGNAEQQPLSYAQAMKYLEEHSPALKEARAEFQTTQALAKVKTPLSNPVLEAGPKFSFGPDVLAYKNQPFGSLGFTIPTGKRLRRQDELNSVNAKKAEVEVQIRQCELVLELRQKYVQWVLAQIRKSTRLEIARLAEESASSARKLMENGSFSKLDTGLLEIESSREQAEVIKTQDSILELDGVLSRLIGVSAELFQPPSKIALPDIPTEILSEDRLKESLIRSQPDLARIRLKYDVAEAQLRLEIAKQYPDFHFGPSFEKDGGSRKTTLGLTLGIELPIFDQNQQGIAVALKTREQVRAQYEAAANRSLASLDTAIKRLKNANERWTLTRDKILPKATENLNGLKALLSNGSTDAIRMLEAERTYRTALIETQESELSLRQAWLELETATGEQFEFLVEPVPQINSSNPATESRSEVPETGIASQSESENTALEVLPPDPPVTKSVNPERNKP